MPQVPIAKREVQAQLTPTPYIEARVNADTSGANVARAYEGLGVQMGRMGYGLLHLKEKYDRTKLIEFSNELQQYEQDNIRNGYYKTSGKDAMGGSTKVMEDWGKNGENLLGKYNFKGYNQARAKDILLGFTAQVQEGVEKHDFQETERWNNSVYDNAYENVFKNASFFRHDPDGQARNFKNLNTLIENDQRYQKLDPELKAIYKANLEGKMHESILDSMIGENSLAAKEYFESNKDKFPAAKQADYIAKINNMENKYYSRTIADEIFMNSQDEKEALEKAEAIEDVDLSDSVQSRIRQKYSQDRRLKEQAQGDLIDNFTNSAVDKFKKGEQITIEDIPEGLDGKHYLQAKEQLEHLNKVGDFITDPDTETQLWYTASNDAERFKTLNLAQYRMNLSKDDYDALVKRQQQIQKGDFYTIIKDNDSTKKYIEQISGIKKDDKILYNEYQGMVRALEQKYGRSATEIEKENILKYLGTNKDGYKLLERGVREEANFYKNIANKISYYSARHNGDMPPEAEVYQWIKEDTLKYYDKKYSNMQSRINSTMQKTGETKTLTYMADFETPKIAKDLDLKITVTSRYRQPNGRYKSHHSSGTAMDVSMSEHSKEDRLRIVGEYLKRPNVKAIGTSDPELIKKYGKDKKIKDERNFDSQFGTNHVNHIHITLIDDGTQKRNQIDTIAIKNKLKSAGYNQEQIAAYMQQRGIN